MVKLSLSELLARGICTWYGDHWRVAHHPALGESIYMADCINVHATIQCPPGVTGIWLLRHAWSGAVEVKCAGKTKLVNLRTEIEDPAFIEPLDTPPGEPCEIQLRVAGDEGQSPNESQVWLFGLTFDSLPTLKSKSLTISRTTRLIDGDWGRFLVLTTDRDIPTAILNEGSWAKRDIELFKKHIAEGDCVLDVGTHVGHHTIVFSRLVGDRGLVLAVEAQRAMFQLLNANCIINGAFNVRPFHMAASDHVHEVMLYPISYSGEGNFGSLGVNTEAQRSAEHNEGETVTAGCLDDLVERYCGDRRIGFIKIDVQTYEKYAIRGLFRTLTKDRPKIFLEVAPFWMKRAGYDYREIYRTLGSLGYRFEHSRTLPRGSDGFPDVPFEQDIEWDTLAVPSER
jgi:FkbM family methyltransferase